MRRIALMAAAIMAQLYYFFKNYLSRQRNKRLIRLLSAMKVLSPIEIIQKLKETKGGKLFQLCRAKIYPSEPCRAALNHKLPIVYSCLFEGRFMPSPSKNSLLKITEPSYMKLKEGAEAINLYQTHKSVIFPSKVIQFKPESLFQRLIETIKDVFRNSKSSTQLRFSDFYNHENVFQLFLPEGLQCTVLGQFSEQGKEVICNRPSMIFQNQKQMISFIEHQLKSMKVVNILLVISFVVCVIILLKELYKLVKVYRRKVKDRGIFGNIRKIFQRSRICMICKQKLSCFLNMKCHHMVVCQECVVKPASACLECDQKECDYVQMYVC